MTIKMNIEEHILGNGMLYCGDFVTSYYLQPYVVTKVVDDNQNRTLYCWDEEFQFRRSFSEDEIIKIDSTLYGILRSLPHSVVSMTQKMANLHYDINNPIEYFYIVAKYLSDYINGSLNILTQRIIFSIGIDTIIKREKNNGIRVVKLKNGEIWRVHRVKIKTSRGIQTIIRNLEKQKKNSWSNCRISSTYYQLIERLC